MYTPPKIAIIGAGLAGLTLAYRLHQKKYSVDLYEARSRVGGRILTAKISHEGKSESFVELGGQNIADGGVAENITRLAEELELEIIEKHVEYSVRVYYQDEFYDFSSLVCEWAAGRNIDQSLNEATEHARSIDDVLVFLFADYPVLLHAMRVRLMAYEGIAIAQQSLAHNMETLKILLIVGVSPELESITFKSIAGGNAILPVKLAQILQGHIHLQKQLLRVIRQDQDLQLQFSDGSKEYCDRLILAVPATVYADIEFVDDIIPKQQWQQLQTISYGTNFKFILPLHHQPSIDWQGVVFDDRVSFFSHDQQALILYYSSAQNCSLQHIEDAAVGHGLSNLQLSLPLLCHDQQYATYRAQPLTYSWAQDVYAKGSYSGYDVKMASLLQERISYHNVLMSPLFKPVNDQIYFIGEHTTILNEIGTMEAAVESGERMAKLLLRKSPTKKSRGSAALSTTVP